MSNKVPTRLPLFLFVLSLFSPVRAAGQSQGNYTYGPLPVFELHSGFWINLHHTLYHDAKLRTTAASPDKSVKTYGPTLNTAPGPKPSASPARHRICGDAVAYYPASDAAKNPP